MVRGLGEGGRNGEVQEGVSEGGSEVKVRGYGQEDVFKLPSSLSSVDNFTFDTQ